MAEKQLRAKEAREKQALERADREAKKRTLVDVNAADDQEGVMDTLMESLLTGTAFNREQKRKRAPRPTGGESTFHFAMVQLSRIHFNI